ncbi:MAG: glycosyltransferase [Gammaproteobacteria bacterium]
MLEDRAGGMSGPVSELERACRSCFILHFITGLETGGAEMMLYKLLLSTDQSRLRHAVVCLTGGEAVGSRIRALGIPVHMLGMKHGLPGIGTLREALRLVRLYSPDIVQGWMHHSNLFGLLVSRFGGRRAVVWNIRQALYGIEKERLAIRVVVRIGALTSRRVDRIIYNSNAGAEQHEAIGYWSGSRAILPNGFDTEKFQPDPAACFVLREELGLAPSQKLVGLVARFHPMKDHITFLRAAARVVAGCPDVSFVLAGGGVDDGNAQLMRAVSELRLTPHVRLLGERDSATLMPAFDVLALSSWAEAFPNVLGEAMACGVPCVVTDVGDCARVLGENGVVVPPRDPELLANGILELLDLRHEERKEMGLRARERVVQSYSLASVAHQYEALYEAVHAEHVGSK